VVGGNGIFVLETRDWAGRVSCLGDNWVNNGKTMQSPSQLVKNHALKIRELILSSKVLPYTKLWVDGIVVLTNENSDLNAKFQKVTIVKLSEICHYLRTKRTGFQFNQQERQHIKDILVDSITN
jgi:hypothetical protein